MNKIFWCDTMIGAEELGMGGERGEGIMDCNSDNGVEFIRVISSLLSYFGMFV